MTAQVQNLDGGVNILNEAAERAHEEDFLKDPEFRRPLFEEVSQSCDESKASEFKAFYYSLIVESCPDVIIEIAAELE